MFGASSLFLQFPFMGVFEKTDGQKSQKASLIKQNTNKKGNKQGADLTSLSSDKKDCVSVFEDDLTLLSHIEEMAIWYTERTPPENKTPVKSNAEPKSNPSKPRERKITYDEYIECFEP